MVRTDDLLDDLQPQRLCLVALDGELAQAGVAVGAACRAMSEAADSIPCAWAARIASSITSSGLTPAAAAFTATSRLRLVLLPGLRPAPTRFPPRGTVDYL